MLQLSQILTDVDKTADRGSGGDRARTLRRLTDLFVGGADAFTPDQIALFDVVIQRFATAIELSARIELAGRLAGLPGAPAGVLRMLALDEIVVARPVLAGSPQLDDQTLLEVALAKGRDHMLAICERPTISPLLADMLVERGDGVVRHAVAGNPGARFSPSATATLVDRARRDDALGTLLRDRRDLPRAVLAQLVEIAKDAARHRLAVALPGAEGEIAGAVDRGARSLSDAPARTTRDYAAAFQAVETRLGGREPHEADLSGLAEEGRVEDVIASMSAMTGLSTSCLERIFGEPQNDLLIVIGKSKDWSWSTVRALVRMRDPSLSERYSLRRAQETFESLAIATACRVVHFLKVRETARHTGDDARPSRVRYG